MNLPRCSPFQHADALERTGQRHTVSTGGPQVSWRSFGDGPVLVRLRGGHGSWLHCVRNVTVMRNNLMVHMVHAPVAGCDALALHVHTVSCVGTRFRSKHIARAARIGPVLERLPCAQLLAWGERDAMVEPQTVVRELAAGHHLSRLTRIIEGAGHWVQFERAAEVNRLLLDWLVPNNTQKIP